jgi:UDP-GlcNAc:undecaprenyl-phosphate GlcNAc-1-phosphate transferase
LLFWPKPATIIVNDWRAGLRERGERRYVSAPEEDRALAIELRVFLAFLVPLIISVGITSLMIRWAPALGMVDIPSDRKVHIRPTPKGGGIGIFLGWALTALLIGIDSEDFWVWGQVGLVIVVLGLVDDIRPLPWQLRLGVQTLAAIGVLLIRGEIPISDFLTDRLWFWPMAMIWIVGLTNAFNMLDNMDALSAGVGWVVAALFAIASILGTYSSFAIGRSSFLPQIMLMGALSGFLWFNRPPARIFMGDAGSTFLGFFFGTSSLAFLSKSNSTSWPLALCFLAIPWYDLVSVVTIRIWQGRSPFHADKQHLSHRLVALGLSPPRAVDTICLLAAVIGAGGLALFVLGSGRNATPVYIFLGSCWLALAAFDCLTRKKRQTKIETS